MYFQPAVRQKPIGFLWFVLASMCLFVSSSLRAEGTWQMGLFEGTSHLQYLYETNTGAGYNDFNVDILNAGEVINVHTCGLNAGNNIRVVIEDPGGNTVYDNTATGTICGSDLNTVFDPAVTNPHQYVTTVSDTHIVRLYNQNGTYLSRYDVTVTDNVNDPVDPRDDGGRLWSLYWRFNAASYAVAQATDANLYVVTDGGFVDTYFVWRLDLNNFAGFVYSLIANDLGVDSPNAAGDVVAGISVPTTNNSIQTKYPIYLSYPEKSFPRPVDGVSVSNLTFSDDSGVDSGISPGTTPSIQDTGTFIFFTNLSSTGVYEIVIDNSSPTGGGPDGIYGQGDIFLRGNAVQGQNSVPWNGEDNNGVVIPLGAYTAKLSVRTGEFHFAAQDVETSGGPGAAGIKFYRADAPGVDIPTTIFWDDATVLNSTAPNAFNQAGIFDGDHNWGNFGAGGIGNNTYIDTYTYGSVEEPDPVGIAITDNDVPLPTLAKSFTPNTIVTGGTSSMQIDITYNGILPLTGIALQDAFPEGMTLVSDASSISVTGSGCSGIQFSPGTVAGGNEFNVIDGNVAANSTCTITATVTSNLPGQLVNTTSGLSSNELATGVISNGASLFVQPPAGGVPYVCDASFYESETVGNSTRLYNIDSSVSPYVRNEFTGALYSPTVGYTYTALAQSSLDNYLYAIVDTSNNQPGVPRVGSILRIEPGGKIVNLGVPVRGPNTMQMPVVSDRFVGGTIGENGRYIVVTDLSATSGTGAAIPVIERGLILDIDLSSSPPEVLFNRRHGRDIGDIVAHTDGSYYAYNTIEGLITIDSSNGSVGIVGGDLTDNVSGLMTDTWGAIYAHTDAGNLHTVDVATGNATLLSALPGNASLDSASCAFGVAARKTVAAVDVAPGSDAVYTISVTNQSNSAATFDLTDVLADSRSFVAGTLTNPFAGTVNAYGGQSALSIASATLAANSSADLQIAVNYPPDYPQGNVGNQASIAVPAMALSVLSDDPATPEYGDTTLVNVLPNPSVGVAKKALASGLDVSYEILIKNAGNTVASNIRFNDNLDTVFGAGNYVFTMPPQLVVDPGSVTLNINYDGSGDIAVLTIGDASSLAVGESAVIRFAVRLLSVADTGAGAGNFSNQVEVFFDDPDGNVLSDLSVDGDNPDPDGDGFPTEQSPTLTTVAQILQVQGKVFEDNGANGALSHNGIAEVSESMLGGITVEARDGSTVVVSTITSSDGSYQLAVPGSYGNVPLQITLAAIDQYHPVSEFFAQDPGSTGSLTDAVVGFTPQLSFVGVYEIDFGLVAKPVWEADSIKANETGSTVLHLHQYRPRSSGLLSIDIVNAQSTPTNPAWQTTLIEDSNCDGVIDAAESVLATPISVDVDNTALICVISKVFIPTGALRDDRYTTELHATLVYADDAGTSHGLTDSRLITDLTTVITTGSGRLTLSKTVQNLNTGGIAVTGNVAEPGHTLRYEIHFANTGSGPITEVLISDSTPAFTTLTTPVTCPIALPANITTCVVLLPTPADNSAGYSGAVQWQFNGSLFAGGNGDVSYDISVQ